MKRHRLKQARGPWKWFLTRLGLAGIVMPWRTIYYLPPWHKSPEFIRHELVHIRQIDRDGPVVFAVKYLYWLARYGYANNPYEVEAYGKKNQAASQAKQAQGPQGLLSHG